MANIKLKSSHNLFDLMQISIDILGVLKQLEIAFELNWEAYCKYLLFILLFIIPIYGLYKIWESIKWVFWNFPKISRQLKRNIDSLEWLWEPIIRQITKKK